MNQRGTAMFNRFKSHFTRQTAPQAKSPPPPKDSLGYFRPQSADELLATSLRRQCLRQLWENSALPDGLYQRFYLTPVRQLLSRVQQVPATREGDWSGSGGFIDLT
ncbi:TraI domain-containing protein, partial [Xenorhabdus sp. PR6a]|uniref:TraI domain-containing protein n=1 Tax=Xenorhabdus sp. PR6a TaxID=3025877 RepID=UPI002359448C